MNKTKGTGTTILRKVLQKYKINIDTQFIPKLAPEVADCFKKTIAVSWVDIPAEKHGSTIYEAALLIFQGNPKEALSRLGEVMSKEAPWFYKMFFKLPTVQFVFKKIENLWGTFFDTGRPGYENLTDHGVTFILYEYSGFPEYMRHYMSGWLKGFMNLLSIQVISVIHDDSNPDRWLWKLTW